jgi:hypothetical protein
MRTLAAGLILVVVGCSEQADPNRFYPPEDRARQALEAALAGWQQGAPTGRVPGTANPAVQLADDHRSPSQRLKSFTILGAAPGDGPRVFTVKLALENPAAEEKVRFVVIGIDPVWVFRHEDYEMMSMWCPPTEAGKTEPKSALR